MKEESQPIELTEMLQLWDGDDEYPYISNVIHKASIEVDEEGKQAVAVTLAMLPPCSCSRFVKPEFKTFVADHPFLFIIVDIAAALHERSRLSATPSKLVMAAHVCWKEFPPPQPMKNKAAKMDALLPLLTF
ncbi:hypothetical protein ACH5RR_018887 [Cinchona calisaya]|uniref:Serpin domain-containing protein n=1 Tax=Cinchona calisaya TaxID=153742 RepID=A0ABD2ZN87_9GENT